MFPWFQIFSSYPASSQQTLAAHTTTTSRYQQSSQHSQLEKPTNLIREKILKHLGKEDHLLNTSSLNRGEKNLRDAKRKINLPNIEKSPNVTGDRLKTNPYVDAQGRRRNEENSKHGYNEDIEVIELDSEMGGKNQVHTEAQGLEDMPNSAETIQVICSGKLRSSVVVSKNKDGVEIEDVPFDVLNRNVDQDMHSSPGTIDYSKHEDVGSSSKMEESRAGNNNQTAGKGDQTQGDNSSEKKSKTEETKKISNSKRTPEKNRRSPEKTRTSRRKDSHEKDKIDKERRSSRDDDNRDRKRSPVRRSSPNRSRSPGLRNRSDFDRRRGFSNLRRNCDRGRRGRFDYRGGRYGGGYRGGRGGFGGRGRGSGLQYRRFPDRRFPDRQRSPDRMRRRDNLSKERNRSHSEDKIIKAKEIDAKKKSQKPSKEEIEKMEEELKKIDLMIEIRKTKKKTGEKLALAEDPSKTSNDDISKDVNVNVLPVSSDVGTAINVAIHSCENSPSPERHSNEDANDQVTNAANSDIPHEETVKSRSVVDPLEMEKSQKYTQEEKYMTRVVNEKDVSEFEHKKLNRDNNATFIREDIEIERTKPNREKNTPISIVEKDNKKLNREKVATYIREVSEVDRTKSNREKSSSTLPSPPAVDEKDHKKLNREKVTTYIREVSEVDRTKLHREKSSLIPTTPAFLPDEKVEDDTLAKYIKPEEYQRGYAESLSESEYNGSAVGEDNHVKEHRKESDASSSSDNESVARGNKEDKETSQLGKGKSEKDNDGREENSSSESDEGSVKSSSSSAVSEVSHSAATDDSDSDNSESDSSAESEPVKRKRTKKKKSKRKSSKRSSNSDNDSDSLSEIESDETDRSSSKKKRKKKKKKKKRKRSKHRKHKKENKSIVMNESQFTAFLDKVKESLRDEIVKEFHQQPSGTDPLKTSRKKDKSTRENDELSDGKDAEIVDSLDELELEMSTHHGFPTGIPLRKDAEELGDLKGSNENVDRVGEDVFNVFKSDDELDDELDSDNWKRLLRKDKKENDGKTETEHKRSKNTEAGRVKRNKSGSRVNQGKEDKSGRKANKNEVFPNEEKEAKQNVKDSTQEMKVFVDKERESIVKEEGKDRKRLNDYNIDRNKDEFKKRTRLEDNKALNRQRKTNHAPEKDDVERDRRKNSPRPALNDDLLEKYPKRPTERHSNERVPVTKVQPPVDGIAIATQVREDVYKLNDFWNGPAKKRPIDMDDVPFGLEEHAGNRKEITNKLESSGRWEAPFSDINNRLAKIADPKYPHNIEEHGVKKRRKSSSEMDKVDEIEKRTVPSKHDVDKGSDMGRLNLSPESNKIDKDARSRVDSGTNEKGANKNQGDERRYSAKLDRRYVISYYIFQNVFLRSLNIILGLTWFLLSILFVCLLSIVSLPELQQPVYSGKFFSNFFLNLYSIVIVYCKENRSRNKICQ